MDDCYTPHGRSAGRMTGPGQGGGVYPEIGVEPSTPPSGGGPVYPEIGFEPSTPPLGGGPVYPEIGFEPSTPPLGGGPVYPEIGFEPSTPPLGGGPVYPGIGFEPSTPPLGGGPVYPGIGFEPSTPPLGGGPVYPGIGFEPSTPSLGGIVLLPGIINPRYSTVRFLNAVADYDPLRITVSRRLVSRRLNFGGLTSYSHIMDGFRLVTITSAYAPYATLYQQTIPFRAGEIATLAVVRGSSGLDLVRISDMPCNSIPRSHACIRAVNLAYPAPPLDVFLSDGRLVFNDVAYKEATSFKQAAPKEYSFFVAQTQFIPLPSFQDIETIEQTPMVAPGLMLQGSDTVDLLASFFLDAKPGAMYSIYILGTWYNSPNLRIRIVEDFFA